MQVYVNKSEILSEKKKGLRPAVPVFYYLRERVDVNGIVKVSKETIAKELDVCPRTVKNWLYALRRADVLKFKFSGKIMINPEVYFFGEDEQQKNALKLYSEFKSDI